MYERYFGFTKRPFSLSPDTGLFVNLADHQRCFDLLIHVLEAGEGFLKVVGDVGTGKTILCRKLLRHLDSQPENRYHSVYIPNPMLSPVGLYRAVGQELGLSAEQKQDNDALLNHITERILALAESSQTVVIVVDEAQSLPEQTLEALRLITNLETEDKKLVQVILFGQTELDFLLNQDRFRQLRQRITFSHYLKTITSGETKQYLDYRLAQSGYNGASLFQEDATKKLWRSANGVPRLINILAHKSLMAAYADRSDQVNVSHVLRAAQDSQDVIDSGNKSIAPLIAGLTFVGFIVALAWRFL